MRAGLEFETHAGLAPKPALDAAAATSATRAIIAVERQASLCAITYLSDSTLVSIELVTTGGNDGVHATITGAEATPQLTACMRPGLESGTWIAPDGAPRRLRFDVWLRAVWH